MAKWNPLALKLLMWLMGVLIVAGSAFPTWIPFDTWFGITASVAGVAFGAAFILARLYPRGMPIWILIGAGCAWERLLDRAHFFSDLVGAVMAGFAAAWLVWHGWRRWPGFRELTDPQSVGRQIAR